MPLPRTLLITALVAGPPSYYVYTTITRLEAKYPRLPPTICTAALHTPAFPVTHHTPHIDIYAGKLPARILHDAQHAAPSGRALSPEEAWARLVLESPALRLEGRLAGGLALLRGGGGGDCGERGFYPGQKLLHGVFEVVRAPPTTTQPQPASSSSFLRPFAASGRTSQQQQRSPLLVQWTFPAPAVGFVRRAAVDWGYPWRFMSGGRHEFGVGDAVDRDGMVEVRIASAHDYERIGEEGGAQKTIPEWTARLHRAYAMWLLDERIETLTRKAAEAEAEEQRGG